MPLRITTWNVNGIRNPFSYQPWREKRTFEGMFDVLESDIVIMQELKIQRKDLRDDMVLVPGWDCYFSLPRHKKGYSGVGIYTRNSACAPIRAEEGILGVLCPPNSSSPYCDLPPDQHIGGYLSQEQLMTVGVDAAELDAEGRCVVLEFPAFVIFGIYSPANSNGLRDDFRYGFLQALDTRVRNLVSSGKRVVVTGDLNVSREEIDTANIAERLKKEGITYEEYSSTPNRRIFNQLLEGGKVVGERDEGREDSVLWDICRGFHPTRKGMYTHWEQKINARPGNFGSRIDYVLCSLDMKSWFCESDIQEGLMGSDHCPVYAVMKDEVNADGKQNQTSDIMNPPGMFEGGKRIREHTMKDLCAFSAKLMPEFDKRRSIRDMFGRKPALKQTLSTPTPTDNKLAQVAELPALEATPGDVTLAEFNEGDIETAMKLSLGSQVSISSPSPMNSPERKRRASGPTPNLLSKRSKSNASSTAAATPPKGQQSLKGFFTSKGPQQSVKSHEQENEMKQAPGFGESSNHRGTSKTEVVKCSTVEERTSLDCGTSFQAAAREGSNSPDLIDPIESKESWSKLFSKPVAPRCEGHDEPCKTMKTKKPGFNCGREFWMCARPLGPTGQKEKNTQWRCATFIWSSDWNHPGVEQNT